MCYSAMVETDLAKLARHFGIHSIEEALDRFRKLSQKGKEKIKGPSESGRFFPNYFAPVVFRPVDQSEIEFMRYSTHLPAYAASSRKFTSFNARIDNLRSSFWRGCFMHGHGIIGLRRFYEWVPVKNVVAGGNVSIHQVKALFQKQMESRKARVLAAGKKYSLTATEQKDPMDRQIMIEFKPEREEWLNVPVIFNEGQDKEGNRFKGFAIITKEPNAEIKSLGHDRMPVCFKPEAVNNWLSPQPNTEKEMEKILTHTVEEFFHHSVELAA